MKIKKLSFLCMGVDLDDISLFTSFGSNLICTNIKGTE